MTAANRPRLARRHAEVGPVELFFDLVYVFAIMQLSHLMIEHLDWVGAAQTVVVFAAIWWGWNYTAWAMNWLDPARTSVQLFNGVLMLAALGMSAAIPAAFGDGAWLFVGCYLFMAVLRPVVMIAAYRATRLAANYRMLLAWSLAAGVLWVLGAALPPTWRLVVWALAVVVDYAAPAAGYRVPGLGSAPMATWNTDAEHLAERNRLVFIIALGESIILMGGAIVDAGALTPALGLSAVIGFASLFVLWWNYFAVAGPDTGGDGSTGALRSAYAYAHGLMVLGAILVAVSIELRLSHPHLTPAVVVVTVAGPIVYLVGNVLFLRSRFGRLARSRFLAIGVLVLIGVAAALGAEALPPVVLSLAVLAVTGTLAALTAMGRRATQQESEGVGGDIPL